MRNIKSHSWFDNLTFQLLFSIIPINFYHIQGFSTIYIYIYNGNIRWENISCEKIENMTRAFIWLYMIIDYWANIFLCLCTKCVVHSMNFFGHILTNRFISVHVKWSWYFRTPIYTKDEIIWRFDWLNATVSATQKGFFIKIAHIYVYKKLQWQIKRTQREEYRRIVSYKETPKKKFEWNVRDSILCWGYHDWKGV